MTTCVNMIITCEKYMLFAVREVRIGKNCARGLEYGPRHSFSQYGPTKDGKITCLFFSSGLL